MGRRRAKEVERDERRRLQSHRRTQLSCRTPLLPGRRCSVAALAMVEQREWVVGGDVEGGWYRVRAAANEELTPWMVVWGVAGGGVQSSVPVLCSPAELRHDDGQRGAPVGRSRALTSPIVSLTTREHSVQVLSLSPLSFLRPSFPRTHFLLPFPSSLLSSSPPPNASLLSIPWSICHLHLTERRLPFHCFSAPHRLPSPPSRLVPACRLSPMAAAAARLPRSLTSLLTVELSAAACLPFPLLPLSLLLRWTSVLSSPPSPPSTSPLRSAPRAQRRTGDGRRWRCAMEPSGGSRIQSAPSGTPPLHPPP